ncbi:MAG: DUF1700 domain-containing protein [Lachnospiraceae bacterium]|nr:DUF1700 domain-containing protein [Lachnospiraceae bacterium]MBR3808659.1 DUF1700 domain-containing protein [Lachnospiraceae bacterium]
MTKQEFLDGLRRSLVSGLETSEVNEHINYYSQYIDSQIRTGIPEEEVMASLGEPRLIAKTLLGMEDVETVTEEYVEDEGVKDTNYRYFNFNGKTIKLPGWLFTILVCVISFFVLTFVFALLTRLLPFFFMIMFGIMVYRFVRNIFR